MKNNIFELSIKNDKRIIPEIALFLSNSANKLGLSDKKTNLLCFAIESFLELRTDQINDDNPEIKIIVNDNGSRFKFSITDLGSPYILTENQKNILKRKLVDRYSFEQLGRKGQCLSFVFYYDQKQNKEIVQQVKEELLDEEFNIRKLSNKDEDILEAIKCLYSVYGYDYYHQNLYSVESFKKNMNSNRYIPIVAENKHSQILCYGALDENTWFMGVPEFSNLSTKEIARGKGLATSLFKEAENIAKKENYQGVHVSAVAYHPYTQIMANKLEYTPSAIEYEINPAGTGGYDNTRRLDCVIGVKIFNKDKKHLLYLDNECNEMFEWIFNKEKLNYQIHNNEDYQETQSEITYEVDSDTNNCFFKIDICSKQIKKELEEIINKEEVNSNDVITVNLNINHPNSILGYKTLREMGFICTGCIPGCLNGDYMLLQSFKVKPEYEKIVVEDNYKDLINIIYKINEINHN